MLVFRGVIPILEHPKNPGHLGNIDAISPQGDTMKNRTPDCSHDTRVFVNTLSSAPHALDKRVAEESFF